MSAFKNYFAPKRPKNGDASKHASNVASIPLADLDSSVTAWRPHKDNSSLSVEDLTSSKSSSYPDGDFRNGTLEAIKDIKCEVMVNWLHSKQEEQIWTTGTPGEGVLLKKLKGRYVCCPPELRNDGSRFYESIAQLNVRVAMTVNTRVIRLILQKSDMPYVEITAGLRLQVIPSIRDIPHCQKHQSAAFVSAERLLIVWEDDPKRLLERAKYIESTLMQRLWGQTSIYDDYTEKKEPHVDVSPANVDSEAMEDNHRPIILVQAFLSAATMITCFTTLGIGWRWLAIEISVDRDWKRLAFLACFVPQIWLGLFFFQALIGSLAQIIGPVGQVRSNTRFYSGQASRRLRCSRAAVLPHVTVQMPVYKEGLHAVIAPTIRSIKAAISTYELQGGTANIFVNDDGMQLVTAEQATERQDFYDEHNIGWVARPKHNPKPLEGEKKYIRAGKFKKASNMNYALWASVQIEAKMATVERHEGWNQRHENELYNGILRELVEQQEGLMWADGNIRVGDYILLIDSDTRVPTDCLLDAVSEMEQSPQVAIIQYLSGVMNVTDSFFEKGITFFTNLIYTQIKYAVANGDVAPFVGHNAVLRWSAMQDIAYDCPLDKREKYWSEKTVSEDFDMALRLQTSGYLVRLAAYKGLDFKEGVSLTVYDELARWEKYAYGCSELIFQPLRYWLVRGPFTGLFCRFISSSMPLPSKFTIMAYVGTYYALGSAWILTLANYFVVGWYKDVLDNFYIDSFRISFSIIIVFSGLGNLALAVLRYRTGEKGLVSALWENYKWLPLLTVFLGGASLHISQAILCQMLSIDMSWGATAKEAENITFFEEIPRVIKRFKWTFLYCFACTAMMVVVAFVAPAMWRIDFFTACWPLATSVCVHFLLPTVLNPNLMLFTW